MSDLTTQRGSTLNVSLVVGGLIQVRAVSATDVRQCSCNGLVQPAAWRLP